MHDRSSKAVAGRTANDRWKDRRRLRTACSLLAGAVLHAAVFVVWPAGEVEGPEVESRLNALELLQVARTSAPEPGSEAVPVPAKPVVGPGESTGSEGEAEDDGPDRAEETRVAGMSDDLFRRIRNRAPSPRLSEPEPELESADEESASAEDDLTPDNEGPSAADVADLLELSDLQLDRLTEVRPELVRTAPAGWVSVKNPTDVRRFMKRMYNRGVMDPDATGSVSVALWIDEEGTVEWAEVTDSSGREEMDRIALNLFREVVSFWPAREGGAPVATSAIFSVVFPWP